MDKGLDDSKEVVHQAGEYLGNKIADAITKWNDVTIEKKNLLKKKLFSQKKEKKY